MPSFVPFVPATGVGRGPADVTVALPDPPRTSNAIVQPGVARHAGATVVWLPLTAAGTVPLLAPATGTCRLVSLPQPLPGLTGVTTILELSPLPFGIAPVLRKLPGFPTFYLAPVTTATLPGADQVVTTGDQLATFGTAFVGMLFDDRVALSPAAWVDQITLAVTDPDERATWQQLDRFRLPGRTLRVLDHVGRPLSEAEIRVNSAGGVSTVTTNPSGILPLPDGDLELTWSSAVQPVHALYERGLAALADRSTSTPPGAALSVPASLTGGHLQLLDAASWFFDRPDELNAGLGHIHPDSRLEPLVDGIATFRALLADLAAATGPDNGAHFTGLVFNDFPLDPDQPDETMFSELVRGLRKGGGVDGAGARLLMDRALVMRPDAPTDPTERLAVLLLMAGTTSTGLLALMDKLDVLDDHGYLAPSVGLITALLLGETLAGDGLSKLEDSFDRSKDLASVLDAMLPGIALSSRHPARFTDNPLEVTNHLGIDPAEYTDGTSSWHQKIQVVRRTPDTHANRVVGYVGGIDINRNRVDSPGHHGSALRSPDQTGNTPPVRPYHDVHARVTGPAAADIALTFAERWVFELGRQPDAPALDLAFTTPDPGDVTEVPPQLARHLVQVGRTGYAPDPAADSPPLPWSELGETTIEQAMLRAIRAAREYIYIEDQYFTPHDEYVDALLDASVANPRLRLVILVPVKLDQVFGDIRRRQIFERLRDEPDSARGWGDRMIVGGLVRRPVLADAGEVASKGRFFLAQPLGAAGDLVQATFAPRARVPAQVPFWLWIEGERMLAVEKHDDVLVDGVPARNYLVQRATGETFWGAFPRPHAKGAPVTMAQTTGIVLHAKTIMVDDVFVSIGSANVNRRGYFHDGEINAFVVPERLKASRENPALALRTALWAEHLGIPPAMGRALLADPVAAFELFRRHTLTGNRVSPFDAFGVIPSVTIPDEGDTWPTWLEIIGVSVAEDLMPFVWNVFTDPTTEADPNPVPGPDIGEL